MHLVDGAGQIQHELQIKQYGEVTLFQLIRTGTQIEQPLRTI